ncbi:MAG: ribonuclease HII [Candidatus Curtissbacteria bacterium]|nr:ribonuclease HII [Candidatus Curtissbacteria bacterium]
MVLPTLDLENNLWQKGFKYVAGIDEVGRGSWAGPLVVASVILPTNFQIPTGLADSKLVKPQLRQKLSKIIIKSALATTIVEISSKDVDKFGVGKATHAAFRKAVKDINPNPDYCLIDAFYIKSFSKKKQSAVKNGDKICASIAAASIIAKVYRDRLMKRLHFKYPLYGFGKHKGYGTPSHQEAIKKYGLSNIHRASYNLEFLFK